MEDRSGSIAVSELIWTVVNKNFFSIMTVLADFT